MRGTFSDIAVLTDPDSQKDVVCLIRGDEAFVLVSSLTGGLTAEYDSQMTKVFRNRSVSG